MMVMRSVISGFLAGLCGMHELGCRDLFGARPIVTGMENSEHMQLWVDAVGPRCIGDACKRSVLGRCRSSRAIAELGRGLNDPLSCPAKHEHFDSHPENIIILND